MLNRLLTLTTAKWRRLRRPHLLRHQPGGGEERWVDQPPQTFVGFSAPNPYLAHLPPPPLSVCLISATDRHRLQLDSCSQDVLSCLASHSSPFAHSPPIRQGGLLTCVDPPSSKQAAVPQQHSAVVLFLIGEGLEMPHLSENRGRMRSWGVMGPILQAPCMQNAAVLGHLDAFALQDLQSKARS
jgi:hypothetical protein